MRQRLDPKECFLVQMFIICFFFFLFDVLYCTEKDRFLVKGREIYAAEDVQQMP